MQLWWVINSLITIFPSVMRLSIASPRCKPISTIYTLTQSNLNSFDCPLTSCQTTRSWPFGPFIPAAFHCRACAFYFTWFRLRLLSAFLWQANTAGFIHCDHGFFFKKKKKAKNIRYSCKCLRGNARRKICIELSASRKLDGNKSAATAYFLEL